MPSPVTGGSIQRLGKDKYRIRWESTRKSDGKRCQLSRTVYGPREYAMMELARETLDRHGIAPTITYSQLWHTVTVPSFEKDELKPKTIEGYERIWNKELLPCIGEDRVIETTYRKVEAVLEQIDSAWVQRSTHSLWRKMINQAIHEGLDMRNPVDKYIRRKKTVPRDRRLLGASEVTTWLESIKDFRMAAPLIAEAGVGLRVEEGTVLCAEDVKTIEHKDKLYVALLINKTLVSSSKGRILQDSTKNLFSERVVYMGEPFASAFLALLPEKGPICSSWYLWNPEKPQAKHFMGPDYITTKFKTYCEENDIEYVNPGKLRKSYSVMQSEAGSQDSAVALNMGHSDGTTRGRSYQKLTKKISMNLADNLTELIKEETSDF